jgi:hypothetical protein
VISLMVSSTKSSELMQRLLVVTIGMLLHIYIGRRKAVRINLDSVYERRGRIDPMKLNKYH